MQTIEAEKTATATTPDIFGNTQLRVMPGPGAVAVYLASTVETNLATVAIGGRVLKQSSLISKIIANAQINVNDDAGLMAEVRGGEVLSVDLTLVAAGTMRAKAIWMGEIA